MPPTPLSHWIGFHLFLLALLAIELLYARIRPGRSTTTAAVATTLWVAASLAFSAFLFRSMGSLSATQYLAGYAIEQSLSIDNLFVFLLLFRLFQIDRAHQPKVLFWGVAGAILLRGAFVAAGLGLLARFHWISYLFAALLLIAAIRLLFPQEEKGEPATPVWITWIARLRPVSLRQDRFWVREDGRPMMTVLFLALLAIEFTDVVFALDSIPAVLSITRHPFLAYTSNIMAVMGLRSLYILLAHLLERLRFLHYGLAAVLAFAALKMLTARWLEIGPLPSLAVILVLLGITIGLSLALPPKHHPELQQP
ncbi:MAG TPA: TerC/Alx family metal homeostasis membrane protein [Granulicella sp.]|nr:TerC/Alx family metal homeostasis membrane protein [Granulicella sp.]